MYKKLLVIAFSGLLSLTSLAQKVGYEIKFKIKDYPQDKIFLGYYYADKEYVKDSAMKDKKGFYVFKGEERLGCGMYEVINHTKDIRLFDFVVSSDEQNFTIELDSSFKLDKAKAINSAENTKFIEFQSFVAGIGNRYGLLRTALDRNKNNADSSALLRKELGAIEQQVNDYRKDFITKYPGSVLGRLFKAQTEIEVPEPPKKDDGSIDSSFQYRYYKQHFWDNFDFTEDCLIRTPVYHKRLERYMSQLTLQIPDSIIASADTIVSKAKNAKELFHYTVWWITNTYEKSAYMCMDAVFVHMGLKYYTYDQAFWADTATIERIRTRANTLKPLRCNQIAPNLAIRDTSNRYQVLHNVKGKFTVLLFWDPDCSHCKKEVPKMQKVYDKLKSYGLEVYAVAVEQEMDKLKSFINEHKLTFINVIDVNLESNFRGIYDISSTPVTYLLDKNKMILGKKMSIEQIEDYIDREVGLKDKNAPILDNKEHDYKD
jgi:peroxiredoxin